MSDDENKDKVNDPLAKYGSRIVFFKSFEEEAEYNAKMAAAQDPVDRIKETVQLILRIYGFTHESLKQRKSSNEIILDSKG